jgi:hypothetical protein
VVELTGAPIYDFKLHDERLHDSNMTPRNAHLKHAQRSAPRSRQRSAPRSDERERSSALYSSPSAPRSDERDRSSALYSSQSPHSSREVNRHTSSNSTSSHRDSHPAIMDLDFDVDAHDVTTSRSPPSHDASRRSLSPPSQVSQVEQLDQSGHAQASSPTVIVDEDEQDQHSVIDS